MLGLDVALERRTYLRSRHSLDPARELVEVVERHAVEADHGDMVEQLAVAVDAQRETVGQIAPRGLEFVFARPAGEEFGQYLLDHLERVTGLLALGLQADLEGAGLLQRLEVAMDPRYQPGGIVLASLLAYFAGEFSNSYTLARMKILTRGRWLWLRTIGSTLVGEGLDTVIFVAIASLARVFPWSAFASLVLTNYLFKVGIEAVMTPVTYRVTGALKRAEGVDWYDTGTDFNPFTFGRDRRRSPSRRSRAGSPSGSRSARPSRRRRG